MDIWWRPICTSTTGGCVQLHSASLSRGPLSPSTLRLMVMFSTCFIFSLCAHPNLRISAQMKLDAGKGHMALYPLRRECAFRFLAPAVLRLTAPWPVIHLQVFNVPFNIAEPDFVSFHGASLSFAATSTRIHEGRRMEPSTSRLSSGFDELLTKSSLPPPSLVQAQGEPARRAPGNVQPGGLAPARAAHARRWRSHRFLLRFLPLVLVSLVFPTRTFFVHSVSFALSLASRNDNQPPDRSPDIQRRAPARRRSGRPRRGPTEKLEDHLQLRSRLRKRGSQLTIRLHCSVSSTSYVTLLSHSHHATRAVSSDPPSPTCHSSQRTSLYYRTQTGVFQDLRNVLRACTEWLDRERRRPVSPLSTLQRLGQRR